MKCHYACGTAEHTLARRRFLGGLAAGTAGLLGGTGLGAFTRPAAAAKLASDQKRVLMIYLHGGVSQLETWDPKPQTDTGGPFRSIPTSVPGLHICELLPETAKLMHHLAVVRSVNTGENDHGKGRVMITTGRRKTPAAEYPHLGAVAARVLAPENSPLPGHIQITPRGSGGRSSDSAYLGPEYASVVLGDGKPPKNSARQKDLTAAADEARNAFRRRANAHFSQKRRTALTDAYTYNYEQARQLMEQREIFDVSREPAADQERYGKHDFGRHCLLARRLLQGGITFVQVSHSNYDTHNENFNFHLEQMAEFDRTFAALLTDIVESGMLESTLVIVNSEFGRTPRINSRYGRDHWSKAWSVVLGGGKIQPGAVIGKTNDNGTEVVDAQVDHGNLFHTYLEAVGLSSMSTIDVGGRELPMADPASGPIAAVLA